MKKGRGARINGPSPPLYYFVRRRVGEGEGEKGKNGRPKERGNMKSADALFL